MSGSPTPETVLQELQTHAEHLAALKMFYAAAGVFRDYNGPLAEETREERERRALEFEARGEAAERERQLHGPPLHHPPLPANAPSPPVPHCPNCRRSLPMAFVICPFCGLDFRTGKTFTPPSPVIPQPAERQTLRSKHRRQSTVDPWAVIALLLALLLAISLLRDCGSAPAKSKSRSVVPPPFTH